MIVSRGYTPSSVLLAIANTPPSTAVHPPNSLISFTVPFATCLLSPKLSIFCESFVLFSTVGSNANKFLTKVFKSALSAGAVYVWFAAGSVFAVFASVRNGLLLSNAFPWRSSLEPEFAIEFVSAAFSVFVALIPTVAFPFVVSTAGACFLASCFVCNFVVATISFACALVNSDCVFAVLKAVFASSKAAFNWFTLSSVLEAYFPLVNFPSISSINFVNDVLSKVTTVEFTSFVVVPFFSIRDLSSLSFAVGFVTEFCSPFTGWTSLAETTELPMNKYKDAIATDAAPKLTFLIE